MRLSEGRPDFTFYDGPPFATGLPHYGHILAGERIFHSFVLFKRLSTTVNGIAVLGELRGGGGHFHP